MSSDVAISIRNVVKTYTINQTRAIHNTLTQTVISRTLALFKPSQQESLQALTDISFDVPRGQVVGLIGRNGAGKSTLLKILSRITKPTRGEVDLYGRVGSLLEVGTGFHHELTGRENIYLNGYILGMTKKEIKGQFDSIVAFAGVEKFLDVPVKRYSSGMYVRLAFAVSAHLTTEILVVDEVLAVGDVEFQKKCLGKMKDVASHGRTVLFVSHNMQSVSLLCDRAIVLESGRIRHDGTVSDGIERYMQSIAERSTALQDIDRRSGSGEYRFTAVRANREYFATHEEKVIDFTITQRLPLSGPVFLSAHVVDGMGAIVAQCDSRLVNYWVRGARQVTGSLNLKTPWLKPGQYRVDLYICLHGFVDVFEGACTLNVSPLLPYKFPASGGSLQYGLVLSSFEWRSEMQE